MTDRVAIPKLDSTDHPQVEWERSERRSARVALAIALLPVPIALVISWSLGAPPWMARPSLAPEVVPGLMDPPHGDPGHPTH